MELINSGNRVSLKPDVIDRHGPAWEEEKVLKFSAKCVSDEHFFYGKAKLMISDLENASSKIDQAVKLYGEKLDCFMGVEKKFVESSKKASAGVRDASQKMADGLAKIERIANFDRLERMVDLLERAEKAISSLSELDSSGRLEKIAAILK